ncbi:MAG TPA: CaiB/BaiF CoA-transferase family protein [Burkholderiaceae bacterium]|jgi:formyl-CoA transferase|nr:CaiB/BaiF CoA-transferase family protein [Burkholderiaceae bacterium]HRZ01401.1 CaiB/BaiF CoA-transferase family protein [Burkholderiaceae bacterium]
MSGGALAGLRVLELGTLIAGPFAARMFAEFGAEVVKVEDPGAGDPIRAWRVLHEGTSLWWYVQSRNKKSIALNLKDPEAQAIARRLALEADVVIENYRPGVLEKWGLGWESLRAERPSLIMLRLSGYGQSGPMRERPGFGAIGESMGGIRYVSGFPDRPPVRIGISIGDSIAALHGVIGALMALRHRDATGGRERGEGQMIDVALYEAVFNLMESTVPEYDHAGVVRARTGGALPGIVPSNTYTCADGEAIVVAGNGDAIFRRLMLAIGRADLADDPALARNDGRVPRVAEIDSAIQDWCGARGIDEALAVLTAADVPVSRIYSVADMFRDEQFAARGMIERAPLPGGGTLAVPAVSPKLSATPGGTRWLGPRLGEHTDEVLSALGLSEAQLQRLRATGAIR